MALKTALEIEAKFSVAEDTIVPDLTSLAAVEAVTTIRTHQLSAIYYDTEDLRLTRNKITLRRRTGGKDDGWHIKLPGTQGRVELHAEMGEPVDGQYQVPEELLSQVRAVVRNQPLVPVAQVDNNRIESDFANAAGKPVCEFCDDRVTAWSFLPDGQQTTWREWEVELAGEYNGSEEGNVVLRAATSLLIGAGARLSSSPSKLAQALGDSAQSAPLPSSLQVAQVDEDSPAAAVITALSANRDKLVEYDPKVRRDEWDSVHQMRVATRELRSHMQTFRGVIGGEDIDHIESELKLLAGMLGKARDAEVVEERWQSLLAAEDSGVLDEETRQHIATDMGDEYRRAHRHVVAALNSERYLELLESLDRVLVNPPVMQKDAELPQPLDAPETDAAETSSDYEPKHAVVAEAGVADEAGITDEPETEAAAKDDKKPEAKPEPEADMETVLAQHLNEAYTKLLKRHEKAVKNWDNEELTLHEREEYYHDMRKAAKKLRYAAEAVGSATKLKTKRLYAACKQLQSTLGDFQDSVTSRDKLLELTEQARRRGEDTFGYGLLYQRERQIGLQALEDYNEDVKAIKSAFKPLKKKLKK
ncbi:CHAD domain-containing protein [Corynebacterium incognita]|uniref:CHAD domain-containing protein n=1 Tax=Corynebacterium incognita TaxID=2754725 RepID=A0A7G7CQP8_9CORY|nr:CYTH and CHAD domain-containing protein [Corynebacterium incognita]QNE89914.1 CHAD domain-containing protein [Corynebacterium incognita]